MTSALYRVHQLLIATAIVGCLGYAAREAFGAGGRSALVIAACLVAAAGFSAYLWRLRRRLRGA